MVGNLPCCDGKSQKSLEHCKDYLHALHHMKESKTLDNYLERMNKGSSDTESAGELNGAESLLQQISREIGIKLRLTEHETEEKIITFIEISCPCNFQCKRYVVFGIGSTSVGSKSATIAKAVERMRDLRIPKGSRIQNIKFVFGSSRGYTK